MTIQLHFAGKGGCVDGGCLECSALGDRKIANGFQTFPQRILGEQVREGCTAPCKAADLLISKKYLVDHVICLAFKRESCHLLHKSTESHNLLKQAFSKHFDSQTYFVVKCNLIVILKDYRTMSLCL